MHNVVLFICVVLLTMVVTFWWATYNGLPLIRLELTVIEGSK